MSYAHALQKVQDQYSSFLASGNVIPAPSVWSSLNVIILIGWLWVSPLLSPVIFRYGRWLSFVAVVYTSIWSMLHCRSLGVPGSIGVGLNAGLCTIFAVNLILLHDPRTFKRLRLRPNLSVSGNENYQEASKAQTSVGSKVELLDKSAIMWEAIPESPLRRFYWILDLLTSLRGIHWSGSLPKYNNLPHVLHVHPARPNRLSSLAPNISRFMLDYLLLDVTKCLMISDPYFLGFPAPTAPPHLQPFITSPTILYTYRMLLSTIGPYLAIDIEFTTVLILQANILGSDIIGINASPSLFPPLWGTPIAIFTKGLRGFWGETWHQMFRMHLASIGDAVVHFLKFDDTPPKPQGQHEPVKTSSGAKAIRTTTAFLLSGLLHACGSYTFIGPTRPWAPLVFFALQPVGMAVQDLLAAAFRGIACSLGGRTCYSTSTCGLILRRAANAGFAALWLWMCAGLLMDDFAMGGMWLFEPVPVSLVRGLGWIGEDGRSWWCW